MKKSLAAMATLALTALLALSCTSTSKPMMMSDHSMISSDGTMMMMNADGTSRPMTEPEMQAHMAMMMSDPRSSSMMMDQCKGMGMMASGSSSMSNGSSMSGSSMSGSSMPSMASSSSGTASMMVMNSDGTSRAMTDAEYRAQMDMMMKNSQMSQMMASKCSSM